MDNGDTGRFADTIQEGRFDSASTAEGWCDGVKVRLLLICSSKVHDDNLWQDKARGHGKDHVNLAKIPLASRMRTPRRIRQRNMDTRQWRIAMGSLLHRTVTLNAWPSPQKWVDARGFLI